MRRSLGILSAAIAFLSTAPAFSLDLSASAVDLTPWGLPGYYELRVDCPASGITAMELAINPQYEPATLPPSGIPVQGNASVPGSNVNNVYAEVIYVAGDAGPPSGDGQPNWQDNCEVSNTAASAALVSCNFGINCPPQ